MSKAIKMLSRKKFCYPSRSASDLPPQSLIHSNNTVCGGKQILVTIQILYLYGHVLDKNASSKIPMNCKVCPLGVSSLSNWL